jgi:hypothetical protein
MKEDKAFYFRTSVLKQSMHFDAATQQPYAVASARPERCKSGKIVTCSLKRMAGSLYQPKQKRNRHYN